MNQLNLFTSDISVSFKGSDYNPKLDEKRLQSGLKRVYELMKDGKWRTTSEIHEILGNVTAESAGRYLRYLRQDYVVDKRRVAGGLWEYRLIV